MPDKPAGPPTLTIAQLQALVDTWRANADTLEATIRVLAATGVAEAEPIVPPLPGDPALSRSNEYVTIPGMPSTSIVAPVRKRRGPPSKGPVTDLAAELGFASMRDLATALKEKEENLRSWNHRGSIPGDRAAKIDKLRAARSKTKRA